MVKFDTRLLPAWPTLEFERAWWEAGIRLVAGIDEAGRGPLAGPVAAAAVILPPDPAAAGALHGVRDSKQMTSEDRDTWAVCIRQYALSYGVGFASAGEIDALGILPATHLAVKRALECLPLPPQALLLDFLHLPGETRPQLSLVKGDARSLSIASASVLAKTARDGLLCELDRQYPGYGFARHKGYGTHEHREALARLGPCPIHRFTFRGVRKEDVVRQPGESRPLER
jgi:ribonuclease HII